MDLSYAPMKIILIGIVVAIFVFAAGCSDSCLNGEDKNITVSVLENKDTQMNIGLTNHHNVTIKIVNIRNTPAKKVEIDTAFCNDFVPDFRKCVNRSFNIDNIPPNGAVQQFFEYDRTVIENSVDGKYTIQYKANSCLPFIEVDNKIFISQR